MYTVFMEKATHSKGAAVVTKYKDSMDAQKIFQGLKTAYADGQAAAVRATKLLNEIHTDVMPKVLSQKREVYLKNYKEKIHM